MQPRTALYALFHWMNVLFVAGVAYATFHTGQGEVAAVGAGLELMWLLGGARMQFFQRYVAHRNGQIEAKTQALRSLQSQQKLSYEYKQRYRDLEKAKAQLLDAAAANKRLEMGAIAPELAKLDELLASFIRIAVAQKKLSTYLQQTPRAGLEADIEKAKTLPNADAMRELAEKRLAEHDKIIQTEGSLGQQLEMIEKTIGYLKTKIVSLEKPDELGQEIENVVMGVEAAERTLAATDKIDDEIRQLEQRAALTR